MKFELSTSLAPVYQPALAAASELAGEYIAKWPSAIPVLHSEVVYSGYSK